MTTDKVPIWMHGFELETPRLVELARRRRLPRRQADIGYMVHCAVKELFGDLAPRPFAMTGDKGRYSSLLAYSDHDKDTMKTHADSFADPWLHRMVNWAQFDAKPMPTSWPAGHRLGFEIRCCPVQRMSSADDRHRKGAEVDVFLAQCWNFGDSDVPVDREAVYREWLTKQFDRHGGARVLSAQLQGFQRQQLVRRTHGKERNSTVCERPDAVIRGAVEITDSDAFTALLRRGIGRHRAFGYGMLLLRPLR